MSFLREAREREEAHYAHAVCHEHEKRSLRLSSVKTIFRAKHEWRKDHQAT